MIASMPPLLIADSRGLDFLNSIATPADATIDWIDNGAGFVAWLREAGLVAGDRLDAIIERARPGELDRVAGEARSLRAWFRGFVDNRRGTPLGADAIDAVAPLNRILERDDAYARIVPDPESGGLALEPTRRWKSAEALLIPVAEALARVVVEEDFAQIKACEGRNCSLVFADHTRGHARRWCSMAVCGNRAKVLAHRERKRLG